MRGVASAVVSAAMAAMVALAVLPMATGGGLVAWHVWAAGAAAIAGAVGTLRGVCSGGSAGKNASAEVRPGRIALSVCVWGVFAWFAFRTFFWWAVERSDGLYVFSPNNTGDFPLHLALMNYLASGVAFWPANPIYPSGALGYPVGVDLLSAGLVAVGMDPLRAMLWVNVVLIGATGMAAWVWGRAWGVAALLFNGGLAGFAIFATGALRDFQEDTAWKSIPLAMLTTQRGLLLAIPAGLLLMRQWREEARSARRWLPVWVQVLFFGAMPLAHMHSAGFLVGLLAFWLVAGAPAWRRIGWRTLALGAVPLAGFATLATAFFRPRHGMGWQPGWMGDGFWFWALNFGVFLPLLAGGTGFAMWRGWKCVRRGRFPRGNLWHFVVPSAAAFGMCAMYRFSPWDWDNTKFFLWSWLASVPVLGAWAMRGLAPAAAGALTILLFFSGFVSLAGGLVTTGQGYHVADRGELAAVKEALEAVPLGERIAVAPVHNHPVLMAGWPVGMGYGGHVWSHGYDIRGPEADLEILLSGRSGWAAAARRLNCRWVFHGPREIERYGGAAALWKLGNPPIRVGRWGYIYELPGVELMEAP